MSKDQLELAAAFIRALEAIQFCLRYAPAGANELQTAIKDAQDLLHKEGTRYLLEHVHE